VVPCTPPSANGNSKARRFATATTPKATSSSSDRRTEDSAAARAALTTDRPQLVLIGSRRVCFVLHNNSLLAIEDKCSHNGESLSKGTVNYLGEVICPWHGYRFNLKTGRESAERSRDLVTFPVKEDGDGVFIGI